MFAELRSCEWDFALVNEKCRCGKEELWKHPEDGHLFLGSGGTEGERGVAIIVHRSKVQGFKGFATKSERACAVDWENGG